MSNTEWAAAFAAAQAEFPPITKTQEVDTGKYTYSYADLTEILEAVVPILNKHGLSVSQAPVSDGDRVGVATRIYHTSGHLEDFGPLLLPGGQSAQSAGSAITYARRYALTAALGISPGEDDDGRSASQPERTDYEQQPGAWLATRVEIFGQWDPDQRRSVYKGVMKELSLERFETMKEAEAVFDAMAKAYYRQFPDAAPF